MTRTGRRAPLASAAVLLGVVSLAGCGNGDAKAAPSRPATPTASATVSPTASPSGPVAPGGVASTDSLVDAARRVIDSVPGSTLTSIRTLPRGWKVTVAGSAGVESDAVVGSGGARILSGPTRQQTGSADRSDHARLVAGATVDYAVAVREIARRAPGALTDLTLATYRSRVVWEADDDSRPAVSVRVDAGDGRVLSSGPAR